MPSTVAQAQTDDEVRSSRMAFILGLTNERVRQYASKGYAITTRHGYYDLPRTVQGIVRYWQEKANYGPGREADEVRADTAKAGLRRENADAELAELKLARERGTVAPVDEMARLVEDMIVKARTALMTIPAKARNRAGLTQEQGQVLEELIRDVCNDIVLDTAP